MPAFKQGGTVTAGNAPGLSDGASATVVVDQTFANEHGMDVLARITGYASQPLLPVSSLERLLVPSIVSWNALASRSVISI